MPDAVEAALRTYVQAPTEAEAQGSSATSEDRTRQLKALEDALAIVLRVSAGSAEAAAVHCLSMYADRSRFLNAIANFISWCLSGPLPSGAWQLE